MLSLPARVLSVINIVGPNLFAFLPNAQIWLFDRNLCRWSGFLACLAISLARIDCGVDRPTAAAECRTVVASELVGGIELLGSRGGAHGSSPILAVLVQTSLQRKGSA